MTSDSTNSYSWDARNRLIKVIYPGSGNYSTFVYDGVGTNVSIVETTAGTTVSTKQFVWCDNTRCEQRNASSSITAQFFTLGETLSGANYFFTADHLANDPNMASRFYQSRVGVQRVYSPLFTSSVREMTNSSGIVQAQYAYDLYGRATKLEGSLAADFQFGDYYFHAPSGLNLTRTRAYSNQQGRFINRDSIAEKGGFNLYAYMLNHPETGLDPNGTCAVAVAVAVGASMSAGEAAAMGAAAAGAAAGAAWAAGQIAGEAMNAMSGGSSGAGSNDTPQDMTHCNRRGRCTDPPKGFSKSQCFDWCAVNCEGTGMLRDPYFECWNACLARPI